MSENQSPPAKIKPPSKSMNLHPFILNPPSKRTRFHLPQNQPTESENESPASKIKHPGKSMNLHLPEYPTNFKNPRFTICLQNGRGASTFQTQTINWRRRQQTPSSSCAAQTQSPENQPEDCILNEASKSQPEPQGGRSTRTIIFLVTLPGLS